MQSGLSVFCFAASYSLALVLEIVGLRYRFGWHRLVMLLLVVAGLVAHSWYLGRRALLVPDAPWASTFDWCLLAAWVLAVLYLWLVFYYPRSSIGLFVLPLVLGLVGMASLASREPFAVGGTPRFWSLLHATMLLLGTVTVCVGFLAGVMYLIQSYRLKRKLPPAVGFRLPSLEWLEQINSRSLGVSALFIAVGFFSGVLLSWLKHRSQPEYAAWGDPVVISLAAMLTWLLVAESFRLLYPGARRGRKVAYLTLATFLFLVFTLVAMTRIDSIHGQHQSGTNHWPTISWKDSR